MPIRIMGTGTWQGAGRTGGGSGSCDRHAPRSFYLLLPLGLSVRAVDAAGPDGRSVTV